MRMGSLRIKTHINQCELKWETSLLFDTKSLKKLLSTVKQIHSLKTRISGEELNDKKSISMQQP